MEKKEIVKELEVILNSITEGDFMRSAALTVRLMKLLGHQSPNQTTN